MAPELRPAPLPASKLAVRTSGLNVDPGWRPDPPSSETRSTWSCSKSGRRPTHGSPPTGPSRPRRPADRRDRSGAWPLRPPPPFGRRCPGWCAPRSPGRRAPAPEPSTSSARTFSTKWGATPALTWSEMPPASPRWGDLRRLGRVRPGSRSTHGVEHGVAAPSAASAASAGPAPPASGACPTSRAAWSGARSAAGRSKYVRAAASMP